MSVYVGTSGYAYKEWKGSFYPEDLKHDDMLRYYGSQFRTVEINNTFYRMPRESVVTGWADQVPEGFRFVFKASRKITHFGRLQNVDDELKYFLRVSSALDARRGPTLFQLPPNFKADLGRLVAFLDGLPRGWPAAFEFRHASWLVDGVYDALKAKNAALVIADTDEDSTPVVATADWGYLRLRRAAYADDALDRWAATVRDQAWKESFVFFKHEDEGAGPRLAKGFETRVGGGP